jgi:hypothetical protein
LSNSRKYQVAHSFLLQPGRWILQGTWLESNFTPIKVKGMTLIVWNRDNWFTMATKLVFPNTERSEIALHYKGRLERGERQYAFLLQHNILGQVEGEGWIGLETIVQRYWVLGDRQRRSGFETLHRISDNTYYLTGGVMAGHFLTSTIEATLEQQPT